MSFIEPILAMMCVYAATTLLGIREGNPIRAVLILSISVPSLIALQVSAGTISPSVGLGIGTLFQLGMLHILGAEFFRNAAYVVLVTVVPVGLHLLFSVGAFGAAGLEVAASAYWVVIAGQILVALYVWGACLAMLIGFNKHALEE